ncbi:MAG: PilZ domain-containing protein [Magnetococcales bacterium]|nr:PilZ domain-containing protein [Magnetococcales bacterium]NGZ27154.1 PilZ domain-containing protein [Magnetococcales bacterium]
MSRVPTPDPPHNEKRRFTRHSYERKLYLEFPGHDPMPGETRDVSLAGVFLRTFEPPAEITTGQEGYLCLETRHNSFRLPCRVVYVNMEGLALNLLGQEAAFGLALTMDAFEQINLPDKPVSPRLPKKLFPAKK